MRIIIPVGEQIFCSWLFHALLFIFYGSHGITHILLIFKGVRELKVRQIDYNIISGW
jgi:hypothetical protein